MTRHPIGTVWTFSSMPEKGTSGCMKIFLSFDPQSMVLRG